jgi:predicted PurR-regulated permease PerM
VNAAQALGTFLTQLPSYGLGLGILLMATYFFLADGRAIGRWLRDHSVLDAHSTEKLIRSFTGACRSVILAGVASGLGQTFIFTLTAWIVGRTQVATLGLALFFASFIPVVGASPITFGVALHEFLTGNRSAAIALLAAAIAASFVDNVIRPWVLKGGANLHPLLGFLGVFGGIHLMGFAGVFLGPILLVLAGAVLEALSSKRQN